jgi:hypothetical protein
MRIYKGVIITGKKGEWFCDLFTFPEKHPFKTLQSVKDYINDYLDNE